ncbi:nicotinate-nucleotide--dimethylbenzimidazole phosphoribosyltransferase [Nakamurella leprariae]|uniref:Nicotinate-nucleotide--dimethylbenzimidazole phosphoribosyltransferase n=1 Tax=Nakamurella leprariae TaxID=2803911 RepID=A0A938YHT0_9ACTN|nr:nicotinate-nucleotide--dimethylbenzimidazole phosphoribosyltransferase [Nakamurella leprariae]MBM9468078.1 nicotinate-nucleotide--dimethylbenzimidazole phosphoribosyltransferase [Nakamurella leprariae]
MSVEFAEVAALDADVAAGVARRRSRLPVGALGVLGPLIDALASARGSADGPLPPRQVDLIVFAADHGVAAAEVSARPADWTAVTAGLLHRGDGPVAALARAAQIGVRVEDLGIDPAHAAGEAASEALASLPAGHRVRTGSGRIDREDALTVDEAVAAVQAGRTVADEQIDAGADLLVPAVCGVGVSTPVAALVSAVTGMEPVDATTRGSGIDDAGWMRKAAIVRDARRRLGADPDVLTMLATAGGADLAALTGCIAQAASRRVPVLVHDVPSALCAVLANRVAPGTDAFVFAAALAPERPHRRLLELLGREPLSDWGVTGECGTAALLVVPAIRAAARALDAVGDLPGSSRTGRALTAWDVDLL